jgi:PHP family Zn ribbon phosphoesterase
MVMRQCLICDTKNYSSDTVSEFWNCCKCGSLIPKSQEKTNLNKGEINGLCGVRNQNTLSAEI